MKIRQFALLAATMLTSLPALAYTGECTGKEANVLLTITTNERGQITDLTLKKPGAPLTHFSEASGTMVFLSSYSMTFSAKATGSHEALELNIAGKEGRMRLGSQATALECDWNQ